MAGSPTVTSGGGGSVEFNVNDDLLWLALGLIVGVVITLVAVGVNAQSRRGDVRRYR